MRTDTTTADPTTADTTTHAFPTIDQLPVIDVAGMNPIRSESIERAGNRARQQGHAAGYAEGYSVGSAAGRADADREVALAVNALHAGVDALAARDAAGLAELTTTAIDLAMAIAEAVLQREFDITTAGRDALIRALSVAPDRGVIDAHLHPFDLETIGDPTHLAPGSELRLVADATVERGGCVLHVGATRIDAQLGTALERVRAELMGTEERGDLS